MPTASHVRISRAMTWRSLGSENGYAEIGGLSQSLANTISVARTRLRRNRVDLILDLMPPSVRDRSGTFTNGESIVYAASGYVRPFEMRLRC